MHEPIKTSTTVDAPYHTDRTHETQHMTRPPVDTANLHTFVADHSDVIDAQSQFNCLAEEVGELAEALNTDAPDEAVAEEVADVLFVARTIAVLHGIDATEALNTVISENVRKSLDAEGNKVTKE